MEKFKNVYGLSDKSKDDKTKKILLIDEIDVLFDKNYYGDTFNLSIDIRDESIRALFEMIWKNKANPSLGYEMVESSKEFKGVT